MRAGRVDAIQVLRLFAAMLVVADHALCALIQADRLHVDKAFAWSIGGFGVKLFFLISGFVMVHSMADRFGTPGATRYFLVRRALRIVPIYWLVLAAVVIKGMFSREPYSVVEIITSFLFVPHLDRVGHIQPILGVGWTLNFEVLFYAVFALCLLCRRWLGVAILIVLMSGLASLNISGARFVGPGALNTALRFWTDAIQLFFVAGVMLGLARIALERAGRAATAPLSLVVAFALCGILAFITLRYRESAGDGLQFALCVAVVATCAWLDSHADGPLTKALRHLGDASYSIYLLHGFVVSALGKTVIAMLPIWPVPLFLLIAMTGSIVAGLLMYRIVERPLLRFLQRRLQPRGEPNSASTLMPSAAPDQPGLRAVM